MKPFFDKKCLFLRNMEPLTLKALTKYVADNILKLILFFLFRENKTTFHVNRHV